MTLQTEVAPEVHRAQVREMTAGSRPDPFATTADPEAYVPRTATEAVLVRLEMAVRDGDSVVLLGGPAGSGRTLMLRVLEERLAGDFRTVYLPYAKLSPEDLCHWVLATIGAGREGDPVATLRGRLVRDASTGAQPLLLLLDDAAWLPVETLRCVGGLVGGEPGALRTLLVRSVDLDPDDLARELGAPVQDVVLEGALSPGETARYLEARLDAAAADGELRDRVLAAAEQLHAASEGNPGRLHAAVARLLFADASAPRPHSLTPGAH